MAAPVADGEDGDGVEDRERGERGLIEWLAPRLAARGLAPGDDGVVRTLAGDDRGVRWTLAGDALSARPWHVTTSPCPFVGRWRGYLRIAPADGVDVVDRDVARSLAQVGRGVVARLDDDRAVATVSLATVDVEAAATPTGLDAGERLLDRDPASAYASDVLDRLAAAAASRGLRSGLRWRRDARNPIELYRVQPFGSDQLYPPVWGRAGVAIDPLRALRGLTVELWLHDLDALDAPGFLARAG
jgi:hypothetical protein